MAKKVKVGALIYLRNGKFLLCAYTWPLQVVTLTATETGTLDKVHNGLFMAAESQSNLGIGEVGTALNNGHYLGCRLSFLWGRASRPHRLHTVGF